MKRKILLIDDDRLVLDSYKNLLVRKGYEVIPAMSCEEALKVFDWMDFDLIISDIRMPGKNGVETVSMLQSNLKKVGKDPLPIIFMTGFAEFADELEASELGEVLAKPVDALELLEAIKRSLPKK